MTLASSLLASIPRHLSDGETDNEQASPGLLSNAVDYLLTGYRNHGPIFRTKYRGSECVVIAGQDANEFFWQNPENWSFADARKGFTNQLGPTHVTRLEGQAHARKRRLLKPGFAMDAVSRHVPVMAETTRAYFSSPEGQSTDLMELLVRLLLVLNSRTLLKVELSEYEIRSAIGFEEDLMFGINNSVNPVEHYQNPRYCSDREASFALLDRQVASRLNGERKDDNLQELIDQEAGELGPLTAEELRYDCYLLLIAGIENTSRLISRCVERLETQPSWKAEIRGELSAYHSGAFARGLGAYPKLRAFIQETERLHPGLIFMSRKPARDLEFKGYTIPAGVTVLQVHTLLHFLSEYYPNPLHFDPSRWIASEPSRKAHVAFGGGTHICLGMNVARLQTPVVLAELLLRYDLSLGYTPGFNYTLDPGEIRQRPPLPINLKRRG